MRYHNITMPALAFAGLAALPACAGSVTPASPTETLGDASALDPHRDAAAPDDPRGPDAGDGNDAAARNDGSLNDATKPDALTSDAAGPPACSSPGSAPTSCKPPVLKLGSTTCNDTSIDAFLTACFSSASTGPSCAAWRAGPGATACGACIQNWTVPGVGSLPASVDYLSCSYLQSPACRNDLKCSLECGAAVCLSCTTPGDFMSCFDATKVGACSVYQPSADGCLKTPGNEPCFTGVVPAYRAEFYRAACTNNATW